MRKIFLAITSEQQTRGGHFTGGVVQDHLPVPDEIAVPGDLQDILVAVQRPATGGTQELDTCRETFDENIKVKAHIAKVVVQGFYAMVEAAEYHATPGLHPRHTLEAKKAFVRLAADLAFLGDTRLPSSDQDQLW